MPKTRYDYEKQHEQDILKINELTSIANEWKQKYLDTVELLNDTKHTIDILSSELRHVHNSKMNENPGTNSVGRKPKLTKNMIQLIKAYRSEGRSQRDIAKLLGVSAGLVNKACNLPSEPQA